MHSQAKHMAAAGTILLLSVAQAGCGGAAASKPTSPAAPLAHPEITISEETTHITSPLLENGYVDYIAAINERTSQGVTPENNAAVLLLQACGPAQIDAASRAQYFQRLGISPLSDAGKYLQSPGDYAKGATNSANPEPEGAGAANQIDEQLTVSLERPWSADEFALLARWLEDSKEPLTLAVAASERSEFYSPVIADDRNLFAINSPAHFAGRPIARALVVRAMMSMNQGDIEAAWQDLLAIHRLARLMSRGPGIVSSLLSVGIEKVACAADHVCAGVLSDENLARQMLADLERLPPMPPFADQIDGYERSMYLNAVIALAQVGPEVLDGRRALSQGAPPEWLTNANNVDWNVPLCQGNEWYDRIAALHRLPSHSARLKEATGLNSRLKALATTPMDFSFLAKTGAGIASQSEVGEKMAAVLICSLAPAFEATCDAETSAVVALDLAKTSLALAGYRARHGQYPATVGKLTPEWIQKFPLDEFSGKLFVYEQSGDGYKLYSVGPNGVDDGGASMSAENLTADDVAFNRS